VRIGLDTNVLLAAFATRGLREAPYAVCLEHHEGAVSTHILGELRRHLTGKLRMAERPVDAIVAFVREHAEVVAPADVAAAAGRDLDDLPVLGTALAAQADMLVTGDRDLLELKRHAGIPIVTPRQCHTRLRAQAAG
jgi:putative PIN family toxin of toxin-antitoxin system